VARALRQFDLVIFDCDGVLVDTEPTANRVLVAMLARVPVLVGATALAT
jgi:beta-phosphoglucomutase-like phosphatase (HAD superfamily)